jgi:hypothetical protein
VAEDELSGGVSRDGNNTWSAKEHPPSRNAAKRATEWVLLKAIGQGTLTREFMVDAAGIFLEFLYWKEICSPSKSSGECTQM